MSFIVALALALLALFMISLRRTYDSVSVAELRRRARSGDKLAEALHAAAAYGPSLNFLLWSLVGVFCGLFFVHVAVNAPTWLAVLASGILVWLGFVWLPASKVTGVGEKIAAKLAPIFAKVLGYIHPVVNRIVLLVRKYRPVHVQTGLYEKADILDLLDRQQFQATNRIESFEFELVRNALTFSDKMVRDVMTPRRVVKMVSIDDDLGPVLMTELHESGFSRFPVYEDNQDNIVGMLFLRDLVKVRAGGKAKSKMHKPVMYLHEEQSLYEALQAILKTRQHLFIVVNSFEEFVGVVSMQDVIEQLVGRPILDEFDQYEDMRAVAIKAASKDHHKREHEEVDDIEIESES